MTNQSEWQSPWSSYTRPRTTNVLGLQCKSQNWGLSREKRMGRWSDLRPERGDNTAHICVQSSTFLQSPLTGQPCSCLRRAPDPADDSFIMIQHNLLNRRFPNAIFFAGNRKQASWTPPKGRPLSLRASCPCGGSPQPHRPNNFWHHYPLLARPMPLLSYPVHVFSILVEYLICTNSIFCRTFMSK